MSNIIKKTKGSVFVQGSFANEISKRMFFNRGYSVSEKISQADVVLWTGGEDINPEIYGEQPAGAHWWNPRRDAEDLDAISEAWAGGKFLVGVCRGAQLLNCVPNGGKLWQDVNNHGHSDHPVIDVITGHEIVINSIHHQQLRLTDKAELVAYTNRSTRKEAQDMIWTNTLGEDRDVEVAFYPDTLSLCYQSHPEFGIGGPTENYFMDLMDRYYVNG